MQTEPRAVSVGILKGGLAKTTPALDIARELAHATNAHSFVPVRRQSPLCSVSHRSVVVLSSAPLVVGRPVPVLVVPR